MNREDLERLVLSTAAQLSDVDGAEARRWYCDDPIAMLGGSTAATLVESGRGARVLDFLMDVLRHEAAETGGPGMRLPAARLRSPVRPRPRSAAR